MDFLASTTTTVLEKALQGLNLRQQALSSNLANVDTPGYRRQDIRFEGALQEAIKKEESPEGPSGNLSLKTQTGIDTSHFLPIDGQGNSAGLDAVKPEWTSDHAGFEYRNDGNNVDVEVEMVRVAQNTQRFVSMAMLEGKQLKGLKSIINNSTGG